MTQEYKLHYPGNCADYNVNDAYGPNTMGELFRPTWAYWDAANDQTTIHFEWIRPPELPALAEKKVAEVEEYERIRALFGTAG